MENHKSSEPFISSSVQDLGQFLRNKLRGNREKSESSFNSGISQPFTVQEPSIIGRTVRTQDQSRRVANPGSYSHRSPMA